MSKKDVPSETAEPVGRRVVVAGLAAIGAATSPPAAAASATRPASAADEPMMREALKLAATADLPFGAVIVRHGEILARGLNIGKRTNDPTAHGEMVAIRHFLADHGAEALRGTTLYTSGEPCPMCTGAIIWSGITRVVYAASIEQLAAVIGQIMVPSRQIADAAPFLKVEITGGLLADEAIELFRKSARP
jgi:tRNA(Arg) A34 adenosine deaminase TadA